MLFQPPAPRAVMYMQTEKFEGKVFWTSPLERIEAGEPQENVIEAKAIIPKIGEFNFSFFPNLRRELRADALYRFLKCRAGEKDFCGYLPAKIDASHVLGLTLDFREAFPYGVASMPEIQFKRNRGDTGFRLFVNDDIKPKDTDWASMRSEGKYTFVYALRNNSHDEKINLWNIKELPLIEITIAFSNGSRGHIILEKGNYGERIVRETIKEWGPRYQ